MIRLVLLTASFFLALVLAAQGSEIQFGEASSSSNPYSSIYRLNGNLLVLSHEYGNGLTLREYDQNSTVVAEIFSIPSPIGIVSIVEDTDENIYLLNSETSEEFHLTGIRRMKIASDLSAVEEVNFDTLNYGINLSEHYLSTMLFTKFGGYGMLEIDSNAQLIQYDYETWTFERTDVFDQSEYYVPSFVSNDSLCFYRPGAVCTLTGHEGAFVTYALNGRSFFPEIFTQREVFNSSAFSMSWINNIYVEKPYHRKPLSSSSSFPQMEISEIRRSPYVIRSSAFEYRMIESVILEKNTFEAHLITDVGNTLPYLVSRIDLGVEVIDTLLVPNDFNIQYIYPAIIFTGNIRDFYSIRIRGINGKKDLQYTIPISGAGSSITPVMVGTDRANNRESTGSVFWLGDHMYVHGLDGYGYLIDPETRALVRKDTFSSNFNDRHIQSSTSLSKLTFARQIEQNGDIYIPTAKFRQSQIGYYRVKADFSGIDSLFIAQPNIPLGFFISGVTFSAQGNPAFLYSDFDGAFNIYMYNDRLENEQILEGRIPSYSDWTGIFLSDVQTNSNEQHAISIVAHEDVNSCTRQFLYGGYPYVFTYNNALEEEGNTDFGIGSNIGPLPSYLLEPISLGIPRLSEVPSGWRVTRGRSQLFYYEALLDQQSNILDFYLDESRTNHSSQYLPTSSGYLDLEKAINSISALRSMERTSGVSYQQLSTENIDSIRNDANDYSWDESKEALVGTGFDYINDPAWPGRNVIIDRQLWVRSSLISPLVSNSNEITLAADALVLFPNPAASVISIVYTSGLESSSSFRIVDSRGAVVLEIPVLRSALKHEIDISPLASGIYTFIDAQGNSKRFFKVGSI